MDLVCKSSRRFYCPLSKTILRSDLSNLLHCQQRAFHQIRPEQAHIDCWQTFYRDRYFENERLSARIKELNAQVAKGGGERAIARHTKLNKKLLIHDRIRLLLDHDSKLFEIGRLCGWKDSLASAGTITGIGRIRGRYCMLYGQDATVKGGTIYPIGIKKQLRAQDLARQLRLPSVHLVDSAGAYLPLQADIFPDRNHGGRMFRNEAVMGSEGLPQVSMVVGSCTAGGAYVPAMCDDTVIVKGIGTVFLGGPPLVKAATGEVVTPDELGGADVHCRESGVTDYYAMDEHEAVELCRNAIDTLNVATTETKLKKFKEPVYSTKELKGFAGNAVDSDNFSHQILARLLDGSEFHEFRALYGSGLVTGYGHIQGRLLGIVSSNGGGIDTKSAQKACQFVQMCEERAHTVLFLQRTLHNGWTNSYTAEDLKWQAQLMKAVGASTIKKLVVNLGDSFGADHFVMCGRHFDPAFYFSWPNATLAFSADEETDRYDSFDAASLLYVDDVIEPKDTRKVLAQCLEIIDHGIPESSKTTNGNYVFRL